MRCILLLILISCHFNINAQDTLWVFQRFQKPYIRHITQADESIFTISRLYNVPLAVLANENHKTYQDGIKPGLEFWIPLDKYNFLQTEEDGSMPLYYTVKDGDELRTIARMSGVTQSTIQKWNNLPMPRVQPGSALQIGWTKYDKTQIPVSNSKATPSNLNEKNRQEPAKAPDRPGIEDIIQEFKEQTGGRLIAEETGAAAFYPVKAKLEADIHYAMHRTAQRGTVVEVFNPATGKTIYAKVVGKLPMLPEYENSIIALSNNAANLLGADDTKIFCKIIYAK